MGRPHIRVIPDHLFYQMWKEASLCSDINDYVESFMSVSSLKRIQVKKYGLNYDEVNVILKEIYSVCNLSFRELLELAKIRKSQISNEFCIPIRTVEDWYAGKNKCPSYIRLSIIRAYRLLYLGKYIYIQSEIDYLKRKKPVYAKSSSSSPSNKERPDKQRPTPVSNLERYELKQNTSQQDEEDFDYREFNQRYSSSSSHISYAELLRRMESYKETSSVKTTEYTYDDYLRRKREQHKDD